MGKEKGFLAVQRREHRWQKKFHLFLEQRTPSGSRGCTAASLKSRHERRDVPLSATEGKTEFQIPNTTTSKGYRNSAPSRRTKFHNGPWSEKCTTERRVRTVIECEKSLTWRPAFDWTKARGHKWRKTRRFHCSWFWNDQWKKVNMLQQSRNHTWEKSFVRWWKTQSLEKYVFVSN